MDFVSKEKRSNIMRGVKGKNTRPELLVRSILHKAGYRFRLHRKDLPGKPDIALPKYETVIFVHGCFWHQHKQCPDGRIPSSNTKFWKNKFAANRRRDKLALEALKALGWRVIVVWGCEASDARRLPKKLMAILGKRRTAPR